jgi:hypothetical protein
MQYVFVFIAILFIACTAREKNTTNESTDTITHDTNTSPLAEDEADTASVKTYSNQRFRDVAVEKVTMDSFQITGQAQVFEATFSWVIEDGHDELQKGFHMTDAGAPEWGNFAFGVRAQKQPENSTLHLILFESSPKDGSRQHELAVPLL